MPTISLFRGNLVARFTERTVEKESCDQKTASALKCPCGGYCVQVAHCAYAPDLKLSPNFSTGGWISNALGRGLKNQWSRPYSGEIHIHKSNNTWYDFTTTEKVDKFWSTCKCIHNFGDMGLMQFRKSEPHTPAKDIRNAAKHYGPLFQERLGFRTEYKQTIKHVILLNDIPEPLVEEIRKGFNSKKENDWVLLEWTVRGWLDTVLETA